MANAADATDRRRFEALTDGARALPEDAKIHINPDKDARLLTITDDGSGMTKEELINNLGTIARSGTRAFGQQLENAKPEDRSAGLTQTVGSGGGERFRALPKCVMRAPARRPPRIINRRPERKRKVTAEPRRSIQTGDDYGLAWFEIFEKFS